MDLVDLLLLFWVALAVGVCGLGSVYENYKRQQQEEADKKRRKQLRQDSSSYNYDRWNPTHSTSFEPETARTRTDAPSYLNNLSSNYDSSPYDSYNLTTPSGQPPHASRYASNTSSPAYGGHKTSPYGRDDIDDIVRNSYASREYSMSSPQSQQHQSLRPQTGPTLDVSSIPTATGFNNDCVEWVNSILYLFYTQPHTYAPQIAENVYRSMNEKLSNITSSSAEHSDLIVEFTGINRDLSSRPELTNIRTESESDKSVSATCKLYMSRIVLDLSVQRTRIASSIGAQNSMVFNDQVHRYELSLENLEGKLKTMAMLNDKLIVVQFLEKPDTKILLKPKQYSSGVGQMAPIDEDALVKMILQTLTQVVVDLYFGDDVDFPPFRPAGIGQAGTGTLQSAYRNKLNALKGSASEIKRHIKEDFFGALTSSDKERKVFIKILLAKNINYNQNVTCLVELDQPYQQALSSTQTGSNPYWDEHFLFNVSDKSSELTLELWDSIQVSSPQSDTHSPQGHKRSKSMSMNQTGTLAGQVRTAKNKLNKAELTSKAKFLGLARVNIDELRRNPVQKCNLTLQSTSNNPNKSLEQSGSLIVASDLSNPVGGELQVELLFLEHSSAGSGAGAPSAQSPLHKSGSTNSLGQLAHGDVVSVDRKLTPSGYVITTTTITKPVGQQSRRGASNHQPLDQARNATLPRNQSPSGFGVGPGSSMVATDGHSDHDFDGISSSIRLTDAPTPTTDLDGRTNDQASRGRSRSRSRSILRAIKKRFSFSRTRSRSVGEPTGRDLDSPPLEGPNEGSPYLGGDRLSVDSRSRASSDVPGSPAALRARSVPAQRDPNEVPAIVINKGRLSDTASAFTFVHPRSQLVIECNEPKMNEDGSTSSTKTRLRYYAIPDDAANKRKWRKRGVKLHLFNEHQFVACHLAGSSTCHLCGRVFSRRPGKQGYKCRNCHLLSHKECHVKVDHNCPYATKDGLKLEYIDADPPANLVMEAGRSAGNNNGRRQQQMRMSAKSISMDMDDR